MKRTVILELNDLAFPLVVEQTGRDSFNVLYGEERNEELSYDRTATAIGQCILHALSCEGKIQN